MLFVDTTVLSGTLGWTLLSWDLNKRFLEDLQ